MIFSGFNFDSPLTDVDGSALIPKIEGAGEAPPEAIVLYLRNLLKNMIVVV
jgi:hypothetical protein